MEKVTLANGRATLYLGDCRALREAGHIAADLIVSDPPYGIAFVHGGGRGSGGMPPELLDAAIANQELRPIIGDDVPFDPAPWLAHCKKVALMGADHFSPRLPQGKWLCWDKSLGIAPKNGFSDAEFCWLTGGNPRRNVYRHLWAGFMADKSKEGLPGGQTAKRVHVSQKPLGLMRFIIEHLNPRADNVVLDPYMGSGSTGVAALSLGLRFIGVEIEQRHFDTACERIEREAEKMGVAA